MKLNEFDMSNLVFCICNVSLVTFAVTETVLLARVGGNVCFVLGWALKDDTSQPQASANTNKNDKLQRVPARCVASRSLIATEAHRCCKCLRVTCR